MGTFNLASVAAIPSNHITGYYGNRLRSNTLEFLERVGVLTNARTITRPLGSKSALCERKRFQEVSLSQDYHTLEFGRRFFSFLGPH